MNTRPIYEKIMLEDYFHELKSLRNRWNESPLSIHQGISSIIDLGGLDYRQYDFIMRQSNEIIIEMIGAVIKELLRAYNIPAKFHEIKMIDCDMYYAGENEKFLNQASLQTPKMILAFSRTDKNKDVLYIFKEYGLNKHIPKELLKKLMDANNLTRYVYISYVESHAYTEILNHNNDKDDPTRGTGIYSLKQFMDVFFDKEEYTLFKSYATQFNKIVDGYYGFALLRTLKPNAIMNFKNTMLEQIKNINASAISELGRIDESQRKIIEQHFYREKNCELLLGSSDFAQSYMTAEWLYTSFPNVGGIDLTAIAMGYFKAIEELLFRFISLHTYEKDGITRTVFVGTKKYQANRGYANLTEAFVNDDNETKRLTLSGLTGFFGYYNPNNGIYTSRNQDLLAPGINQQTYNIIIEYLSGIAVLRNGFFHKENLNDWNTVIKARKNAQIVFYSILGAYTLTETEKNLLGLIKRTNHDDFFRLCEYINHKYYDSNMLARPIYYFKFDAEETIDVYNFVIPYRDNYIEYDNYGEPTYSGVFFVKCGNVIKLDKDSLPQEIWEGSLIISNSIPISITPTGPQKSILCNGKFVDETNE